MDWYDDILSGNEYTDEDRAFLRGASCRITDADIHAAYDFINEPNETWKKIVARHHGARPLVFMALCGFVKQAVVRDGQLRPGLEFVDPWRTVGIIDHKDIWQCAAFAIYRLLERGRGTPGYLFIKGSRVN